MNRLIIVGASGHGKVVADIAVKNGYNNIVFLDDDDTIKECAGFKVEGKTSEAASIIGDKIVAIGDSKIRERIQREIDVITLVHPSAVIGRRVEIGKGTVIMAGAVINSDTKIGDGCIINTASSVDHDCIVDDFSHVAVGAHLCGAVHTGRHCWVGAGATVSNNIAIGSEVMLGAGAVVVKDIQAKGIYVGVPAVKMAKGRI